MPSTSIAATGSVENMGANYQSVFLADAGLNSLASGGSTSSLVYTAPSGSSGAKVLVVLGEIDMAASGTLSIDDGTSSYDMAVDPGNGARRIEFESIPSSVLSSFVITNSLGVSLASSGNSVAIQPL
jgi:hypothetical protein